MIDSGSRDRSRGDRPRGRRDLIEIPPEEFGHGRTRNLGAERSSGDLICFLTQDAVPVEGWLDALPRGVRARRARGRRVRPAPPPPGHEPDDRPRADRVLRTASRPTARPALQRRGDLTFLSNVNACYARACWARDALPGRRVRGGPGLRPRDARGRLGEGLPPGAAVRHAHDYGPLEFARRYFDEYRGLRETTGHVEPLRPKHAAARAGARRALDARAGHGRRARGRAGCRASAAHHAGRRVRLRARLARRAAARPACSARSRSRARRRPARAAAAEGDAAQRASARRTRRSCASAAEGPAPLEEPVPGMADRTPLHIAVRDPAVRHGQRRAQARSSRWSTRLERAGPHLLASGCTTRAATTGARPQRCSGAGSCEEFVAGAGAGLQGLRRLARRRRGGGHRLGHRLPGDAAAALPGARLPDQRPRAGVLRHLRRRPCGPRAPTSSACTASRRAAGCATCWRAATGSAAAGSGSASTTAIYRPGPVERRRDTVDLLRARATRRGGPFRSASSP